MPKSYRVIDLRRDDAQEISIVASTPEGAASDVLGIPVFRGGHSRTLVAKVYSEGAGGVSMVRLYSKAIDRGYPKESPT